VTLQAAPNLVGAPLAIATAKVISHTKTCVLDTGALE
jgi:hypothetical protein